MNRYHCIVLLGLILTGCAVPSRFSSAPGAPSSWPYHRGNTSSLGADSSATFSGSLKIRWERNLRDKPVGPMTIIGGRLFYPSSKKKIKVLDLETGQTVAQFKTRGAAQTAVVAADSLIFFGVGAFRNEMVARNGRTGATRWTRPIKDIAGGSIIVNERLIIGDGDDSLKAFDLAKGREAWAAELEGKPIAAPSCLSELVIQPTDAGYVYAVSSDSGKVVFRAKLKAPCLGEAACGGLIWVGDVRGNLYGLNPADGRIEWQRTVDGPIWSPVAVAHGSVFAVHSGGQLMAFDGLTGRDLWTYTAGEVVKAAPLAAGECVMIGTLTGRVLALRSSDGSLIDSVSVSGPITASPVTDGKRVYIATDKGRLICFGETNAVNAETGNTGAAKR